MAGGIALTATWNPALAELVGTELGRDSRAKGVHFLLAPAVNINRAPMNGRNFEYFGEDPFLGVAHCCQLHQRSSEPGSECHGQALPCKQF